MTPKTLSTPRSPRLVTVIVGSDISELRSEPARARETRSRKACISSSSVSSVGVVERGRDEPAAAQRDGDADVDVVARGRPRRRSRRAFSSGTSRSASATALTSSTPWSSRSVTGRRRVLLRRARRARCSCRSSGRGSSAGSRASSGSSPLRSRAHRGAALGRPADGGRGAASERRARAARPGGWRRGLGGFARSRAARPPRRPRAGSARPGPVPATRAEVDAELVRRAAGRRRDRRRAGARSRHGGAGAARGDGAAAGPAARHRRGSRRAVLADHGEHRADRHLRARLDQHLLEHAARRRPRPRRPPCRSRRRR